MMSTGGSKSLVTTESLRTIEIRVDTGVNLVQEIRLVRTGGMWRRASVVSTWDCSGQSSSFSGSSVASSVTRCTVITVGINTGISLVGKVAGMWARCSGVVCTSKTAVGVAVGGASVKCGMWGSTGIGG